MNKVTAQALSNLSMITPFTDDVRERCENVEEHGCTYVRNEDDEPSSDEDEEAERSDDNESDNEPKADHLYDLVKEYEE